MSSVSTAHACRSGCLRWLPCQRRPTIPRPSLPDCIPHVSAGWHENSNNSMQDNVTLHLNQICFASANEVHKFGDKVHKLSTIRCDRCRYYLRYSRCTETPQSCTLKPSTTSFDLGMDFVRHCCPAVHNTSLCWTPVCLEVLQELSAGG